MLARRGYGSRADYVVADSEWQWHPDGAIEPLRIDVAAYFDEALGKR
ncbi:MAG: hypothetical protein H7099_04400 [Gemmatimonadaceae bacterium]|nr:hypothetical protein [Gemmatimonadaceae bacterium]